MVGLLTCGRQDVILHGFTIADVNLNTRPHSINSRFTSAQQLILYPVAIFPEQIHDSDILMKPSVCEDECVTEAHQNFKQLSNLPNL